MAMAQNVTVRRIQRVASMQFKDQDFYQIHLITLLRWSRAELWLLAILGPPILGSLPSGDLVQTPNLARHEKYRVGTRDVADHAV